jgi:hypothetical protein
VSASALGFETRGVAALLTMRDLIAEERALARLSKDVTYA